ncbi:MAG: alpha/beta fold hydrolase [Steroidobacteraceae bacterium]|jgi:predicted alpha/beta hydrolase
MRATVAGASMIRIEPRLITAQDGHELAATFYRPEQTIVGSVLIAPAMGVSQRFYAALATWLACRGFLVVTFDFNGIGLSRRAGLRTLKVTITDWATSDCEAVIAAVSRESPARELYWLGHSLGGQILGLVPSRARITKVVTIACGSGYWMENTPSLKWKAWWLWYVVAPISMRLFGYFPGRRLRKVGDLPRGVMEQWRRWCLNRDYAVGVEGPEIRAQYAAMTTPITSFSFVDDEFMSARNTEALHGCYENSGRTMKRISPRDVGAEHIGHFGFFDAKFQDSLWQTYLLPELA